MMRMRGKDGNDPPRPHGFPPPPVIPATPVIPASLRHSRKPYVIPAHAGIQGKAKHAIFLPFAPRRGRGAQRRRGCTRFRTMMRMRGKDGNDPRRPHGFPPAPVIPASLTSFLASPPSFPRTRESKGREGIIPIFSHHGHHSSISCIPLRAAHASPFALRRRGGEHHRSTLDNHIHHFHPYKSFAS